MLAIGLVELGAAIWLVRLAARRWWEYLVIAALTAALVRPLYALVTGDMSRVLPSFLWSDGADGKDDIILVSIVSTLLLPLIVAALAFFVLKQIWRAVAQT